MAKPGPSLARKVFLEIVEVDSPPLRASKWITKIGLIKDWFSSELEAAEAAERWEQRFLDYLRDDLDELNHRGKFSPYAFNSSSLNRLQGSAYIEPNDSKEVKEAKARRARFKEYEAGLRRLTPEQFEAMCAGILHLIGVRKPILTPYSADEGIDFFGQLRLEDFILQASQFPGIQRRLSVWMVGQAKHYIDNRVSTPDVRELVGSVELAKGHTYSTTYDKYPDLGMRVCDPVFYLFFTTGRISSDSWQLLDNSGVIGMDGGMVAAFLADHGIGVELEEFNDNLFLTWIEEHRNSS